MKQGIQVQMKQVWKRKKDGRLVRVRGLIFLQPKRVMWQALPNQTNQSFDGVTTEPNSKNNTNINLTIMPIRARELFPVTKVARQKANGIQPVLFPELGLLKRKHIPNSEVQVGLVYANAWHSCLRRRLLALIRAASFSVLKHND